MKVDQLSVWNFAELPGVQIIRNQNVTRTGNSYVHEAYGIYGNPRGEGQIFYRGRNVRIVCPGVDFIEPGETYRSDEIAGYPDSRVFLLPVATMAQASEEITGKNAWPHFLQTVRQDPDLLRLMIRFHEHLGAEVLPLEREARFARIMRVILERHIETRRGLRPEPFVHQAVKRVKSLIVERYRETLSLQTLSEEAGISRFHLARAFQRQIGVPPHEFQIQVRLGQALVLLGKGVPPAFAAADVGFTDQSHLNRHLKRVWGATTSSFASPKLP